MRTLKIMAAALIVGVSGIALAQTSAERPAQSSFGTEVSGQAQAQRDTDTRGIGADVRIGARQQGTVNRNPRATDSDDGDADEETGESHGIGSQVRVLAQGQRDSEQKGIGEQVRALTPAAERSNRGVRSEARRSGAEASAEGRARSGETRTNAQAVAAARGSNREIRGGAGAVADLRSSVAATRSSVASTRSEVAATRASVASTRAEVAATRSQAAAARNDARSAAQQARQVRETVRAARSGRRGG